MLAFAEDDKAKALADISEKLNYTEF